MYYFCLCFLCCVCPSFVITNYFDTPRWLWCLCWLYVCLLMCMPVFEIWFPLRILDTFLFAENIISFASPFISVSSEFLNRANIKCACFSLQIIFLLVFCSLSFLEIFQELWYNIILIHKSRHNTSDQWLRRRK